MDDESTNFRLHIGGFSGTAINSFVGTTGNDLDGMPFSSYDRDNDMYSGGNCALLALSGFWYNNCGNNLVNSYGETGDDFRWSRGSDILIASRLTLIDK